MVHELARKVSLRMLGPDIDSSSNNHLRISPAPSAVNSSIPCPAMTATNSTKSDRSEESSTVSALPDIEYVTTFSNNKSCTVSGKSIIAPAYQTDPGNGNDSEDEVHLQIADTQHNISLSPFARHVGDANDGNDHHQNILISEMQPDYRSNFDQNPGASSSYRASYIGTHINPNSSVQHAFAVNDQMDEKSEMMSGRTEAMPAMMDQVIFVDQEYPLNDAEGINCISHAQAVQRATTDSSSGPSSRSGSGSGSSGACSLVMASPALPMAMGMMQTPFGPSPAYGMNMNHGRMMAPSTMEMEEVGPNANEQMMP